MCHDETMTATENGPLKLAPFVALYPAGSTPPELPSGAIVLPTVPSRAFGDGSHPTTRLCARAVDLFFRQRPVTSVLDVGTGTGVLARLARAHGARFVVGTDLDPAALGAARANAALDHAAVELILSESSPDAWGPRFDLVVANILEGVLLALAPALVAALVPGGTLLLSGFTPVQTPSLLATFTALGMVMENPVTLEGWALLQGRRIA